MKIAILYSGLVRTLPEIILKNLACFDYSDIDLYFSIWDYVGYADNINAPDNILSSRLLDNNIKITEDIIRNIVPDNINIKTIKIETYNPNNYKLSLINGIDHQGLAPQFYKVWDCFTLLNKTIEYDAVIRMRCDILLQNKINKEHLSEIIHNNKILFASKIWYDYSWKSGIRSINDMFWASNVNLMEKACSIYNNVDKINSIISNRNQKEPNYGESICFMNLEAEGISNNIETFDFDYLVLR